MIDHCLQMVADTHKRLPFPSIVMNSERRQWCPRFVFAVLMCALVFSTSCKSKLDETTVLDQAEAARLAARNPINYGQSVRITGVVTYFDPDWHLLFLQDESGGFFVNLQDLAVQFTPGQLVEVTGRLAASNLGIDNPRFRILGQAKMPVAQPLPDETDPNAARLSQWVACQGTIRRASIEDGRLTLIVLDSRGRRIQVRVLGEQQARTIAFFGVGVQVEGVSAASVDARGTPNGVQVFVSSLQQLKPTGATGFADPFTTKPQPLSLANDRKRAGTLVHLAGTTLEGRPGRLVIGDGNLRITAQLADSYQPGPGPGDSVELFGFVSSSSEFDLEDTIVRVVAPRTPLQESQINGALQTVRSLKSLSVETAAKRLPVDVTGTVTFFDPPWSLLFVQDNTGGVYVDIHNGIPDIEVGDRVRVQGFSGPGDYAPIITSPTVRRIGHAAMPTPLSLSWQTLVTGRDDAGWVEVVGVVHSVSELRSQHSFQLVVAGNSYTVQLAHSDIFNTAPEALLDAQVRVRGVCGAVFNEKRQLVGLKFFVPGMRDVEVLEAAPPESAFEARPIVSLLRFDPLNLSIHRTKVRGSVTFVDGNRGFYLQDSSAGIYVLTNGAGQVLAGQSVEVTGFAVAGANGLSLEDAVITPASQVAPVSPLRLTADDLANGDYGAQLVTVQGRLLEQVRGPEGDTLFLRSGNLLLRATLRTSQNSEEIRRSSLLEITGILHADGHSSQPSIRILVPSLGNIRILEAASWWTPEHVIRTLIVALIVFLAVMLWLSFAAYRVRSYQAEHDLLTGLPNRRSVLDHLDRQLARATREKTSLAVILADVDHFKLVNDTYGHQAGDTVLKNMAQILRIELRPYDAVGRYGGEEFLLVIPTCDSQTAREIANRIRVRILEEPFTSQSLAQSFHITCSFGIAIAESNDATVDSLLASADRALYAAKGSGRNNVVLAEDLNPAKAASVFSPR